MVHARVRWSELAFPAFTSGRNACPLASLLHASFQFDGQCYEATKSWDESQKTGPEVPDFRLAGTLRAEHDSTRSHNDLCRIYKNAEDGSAVLVSKKQLQDLAHRCPTNWPVRKMPFLVAGERYFGLILLVRIRSRSQPKTQPVPSDSSCRYA